VDTFSRAMLVAVGHVHLVAARAAVRNMPRQYGFANGIRSRRAAVAILELDHFRDKNVVDSLFLRILVAVTWAKNRQTASTL
jgi:hypothetical protein